MRTKLIKLLRSMENDSGFRSEYSEFDRSYQCDYSIVDDYLDFPNYKFVIKKFNDEHSTTDKNGVISLVPENSIKAELKRMELDELITIGTQKGIKYAFAESNRGPDFDEGTEFTSESIVLTTKGKSRWKYFWYQAMENPFTLIALIFSFLSLLFSTHNLWVPYLIKLL